MPEIDIDVEWDPVRVVPVPVTTVDVTPILGPCKLCGWSLRDATGDLAQQNENSVTSPAAGGNIVGLGATGGGTYTVEWTVSVGGTLAAGDANNMKLVGPGGLILNALYPAVAGDYPQPTVQVTLAAGNFLNVQAIAAATVGGIYSAQVAIIPVASANTVCELQDGNNALGEVAVPNPGCDTHWFGGDGLKVRNQLKMHIVSGAITGALYVRFQKNTG